MQGLCTYYYDYEYDSFHVQIHVEHAIGLLKKFQVFQKVWRIGIFNDIDNFLCMCCFVEFTTKIGIWSFSQYFIRFFCFVFSVGNSCLKLLKILIKKQVSKRTLIITLWHCTLLVLLLGQRKKVAFTLTIFLKGIFLWLNKYLLMFFKYANVLYIIFWWPF